MKNLHIFVSLCLLLSQLTIQAQQQSSNSKANFLGTLINAENKTPIEFATISVFDVVADKLVTGTVSNKEGEFSIMLPKGRFKAMIESISFQTKVIETFDISAENSKLNLGTIELDYKVAMLDAVEMTAEKSRLQFALDKKIYNLNKDITNVGGSVTDVLDNIPSIQVDPQGRVSLRGSQSVKILIDGKPSAMTSAKQLQQIQSNQVEQIEIITNPSAKYDAEGLSGIINIVMKKEKGADVGGSLYASLSYPQDYNLAISLNRRKKKLNLFTNIGLRHWQRPITNKNEHFYRLADTTYQTKILSDKTRRSYSANAHIGLDYHIDEQSVLTTSFLYDIGRQPHDASTFYQDFLETGNLISNELRTNDELEIEYSLEYMVNYEKRFKQKGRKLEAFVKYIDNSEDNHSNILEYATDADRKALTEQVLAQKTAVDERDQNLIFQLDYLHPFGEKGKIETGGKSTSRHITNDFLVEELTGETWSSKKGLSNDFMYSEQIYALYATLGDKMGNFSYKAGLRGELTDIRTELIQTAEVNDRKPFFNLFPSLHLGYAFKGGNTFQLSYSRRIQRPQFQNLNPFFSFTDDRFITTGNPNLNPMYTHSLELGYMRNWERTTVGSSMYYRHTNDLIDELIAVNENGITTTSTQNLSSRQTMGMEFFMEKEMAKWLEVDANLDLLYSRTDASILQQGSVVENYFWMGRIGAKMDAFKQSTFQVRYFYAAPRTTIQGRLQSLSRFDVAWRRQVMDGKGRWSVSVKDLFFGYKFRYENTTPSITSVGISIPWRPTIALGFQYRWK